MCRREGLRLNFQRSISEPQGQKASKGLCPPTDVVISPPSCSPSLHPLKRCKLTGANDGGNNTVNNLNCISTGIKKPRPPCILTLQAAPLSPQGPPSRPSAIQGHHSIRESKGLLQLIPPSPAGSVSLPNSPCSESSTLQRTLLIKNVTTLVASKLAEKLNKQMPLSQATSTSSGYLLVDCRPFIAYNVSHIKGAINVNCCNRLNRKRLQMGKASLADLATTKEGKDLLKKRSWKEVVVYDDSSESLEKLPTSHTLFLVMNALLEDGREPRMLLGGLKEFQQSRRSLCEDHLNTSQLLPAPTEPLSSLLPDLPSPTDICDTKDIENHPATQVLPHMYLGNMRDASDANVLHRLGVGYVLNVTAKQPSYTMDPAINYKQLVASDNGLQNLRQFFDEAFEFIDEAKNNRSGVLIHCQAGISRSPTIAVAYLMKHYPMAMAEAYKFVKTRRSIISPNLNFMGQLWEFEQGLKKDRQQDEAMSTSSSSNGSSDGGSEGTKEEEDDEEDDVEDEVSHAAAETSGNQDQSQEDLLPSSTRRKNPLAVAIEDACNQANPRIQDSWSDKVAASSPGSRAKETGSL